MTRGDQAAEASTPQATGLLDCCVGLSRRSKGRVTRTTHLLGSRLRNSDRPTSGIARTEACGALDAVAIKAGRQASAHVSEVRLTGGIGLLVRLLG